MASAVQTGELSKTTSFITIGDQYTDKKDRALHEEPGVRQFQTTVPRSGQTGGNWGEGFRKVERLYEGEKYEDMAKVVVRERLKSREKWIEPKGFIPSSPAKKLTGPGTYDGAFAKYDHRDDGLFPKRDEVKKPGEPKARNILTSPSKKGTFGYAGVTLGPPPAYASDGYMERLPPTRKVGQPEGKAPFKSASSARGCLDVAEHAATGASRVYTRDGACLPPKPDPEAGLTKKQLAEKREAAKGYERPFRQSTPAKKGYNATFSPFPKYSGDKYDPKQIQRALAPMRLAPEKERRKKLPDSIKERPPFKPSSGPKTDLTKSIARGGIFRASIGRSVMRRGRR